MRFSLENVLKVELQQFRRVGPFSWTGERSLVLNIGGIRDQIQSTGFVVEVESEIVQMVQGARAEYFIAMLALPVHAPRERFSPKKSEHHPWRKFTVGSANGVGESYAQMLQTTYFHERNVGTPYLTALFGVLICLRNRILGIGEDFGSRPDRDDFWNACRIHHYPRGGSFMVEHNDTHFPQVLASADVPSLQVMALLSTKGVDFQTGGSFVVNREGNRTYLEDGCRLDAVVMFDGSIRHGVEDVDPDQVLDFNLSSGGIAAFVNLY